MKSKKIVIVSLIATLLLIFTLSVSAAEEPAIDLSFTMEPSSSFVTGGSDFTVALNIDNNTGFKAAMVTITYDASKLTFKGHDEAGTKFENIGFDEHIDDGTKIGTIKVEIGNALSALTGSAPVQSVEGLVSTLKFKAIDAAVEATSIDLTLSNKYIIDENKMDGESAGLVVTENVSTEISVYKADHVHVEETVKGYAATCTDPGLSDGIKCSICGTTLKAQTPITELKHPEASQEVIKGYAATCGEKGLSDGKKCGLCGETVLEQKPIDELKHPAANVEILKAVDATCAKSGLTEGKKCGLCGDILEAQKVVDALHHPKDEWEAIKAVAATCTKTGLSEGQKCGLCGETVIPQVEMPALGHPATSFEAIKAVAATCTKTGLTEGQKCKLCGETVVAQVETPALGHPATSFKSIPAVAATCTEKGLTEGQKCGLCDEVVVAQVETPALDHPASKVEIIAAVEATCTNAGSTAGLKCTLCNKVITEPEDVAAKGHKYGDFVVTKEATKKEEGVKTSTCPNCGDAKTETIAKLDGCGSAILAMPMVLGVVAVLGAAVTFDKKRKN